MIITLFRNAGATGHVFIFKRGRAVDKGLAYSGLILSKRTVAVVPTTAQIVNFAIEAQTADKQNVTVSGSASVTLIPTTAVSKFDFTVNPRNGSYQSNWQQVLQAKVIERVLRAVLSKVRTLAVEDATRSQKEIEDAITAALDGNSLGGDGIVLNSCSIPQIEPDDDIGDAIGQSERQTMLTEADKALHERRLNAAENERKLKQYEQTTRLELEKANALLIEEQSKNKAAEAKADAEATKTRLEALNDTDPGKVLGAALLEAAKTGKFGSLAITTELLSAIGVGARK